jgi:aspartate racemase
MTSNSPRTIGLIGGMSWESTAEYYRLANVLTRERLGGLHSARVVAISLDFAVIEPLQAAGQWHEAGQILAVAAQRLEAAAADLVLICTNTMHIVADQVQAAIGIPLLHIADVAAAAVKSAGLTTVGLLGTAFTMEQSYYRDRIESHGITVITPPDDDRADVHRIIYDELCLGELREDSRQLYREIIWRLITAGAEGIILGCTEIELLVSAADSPVPIFPTTRLHVVAALDAAHAADASTERPGGSGGAATSDPSH